MERDDWTSDGDGEADTSGTISGIRSRLADQQVNTIGEQGHGVLCVDSNPCVSVNVQKNWLCGADRPGQGCRLSSHTVQRAREGSCRNFNSESNTD